MSKTYAGDVSPEECWAALASDPRALLVDVRTAAEWTYVGFPVLDGGRRPLFQEWQSFPTMAVDPGFSEKLSAQIEEAGGSRETAVFLLCRSGVRSIAGAEALTAAGFARCFNVLDGFEGPPDAEGHRGRAAGWKAEGLPWGQR
ncbi:MAG: rhodanese-like domain-containing protein [Rhizobiaceae bacterium]|nr:rhodanese-like domain-containing protein [Rhizobiaceae bacterium]